MRTRLRGAAPCWRTPLHRTPPSTQVGWTTTSRMSAGDANASTGGRSPRLLETWCPREFDTALVLSRTRLTRHTFPGNAIRSRTCVVFEELKMRGRKPYPGPRRIIRAASCRARCATPLGTIESVQVESQLKRSWPTDRAVRYRQHGDRRLPANSTTMRRAHRRRPLPRSPRAAWAEPHGRP